MAIHASDIPSLVIELNRLSERLKQLELENIDLGGRRRVINAARSRAHDDYITRGEVEEFLKNINDTLNRLKNVT